jgi:hemoglobin-like flavoprotein
MNQSHPIAMRGSFIRCLNNMEFFKDFYASFFASSAEAKGKFSEIDMSKQMRMLAEGITELLDYAETEKPSQKLEKLAKLHSRTGMDINPRLYPLFIESLILTVSKNDSDFNEEVEVAWHEILKHGTDYFISKY